MARVKLDEILDEHQADIRAAMKKILQQYAPELEPKVGEITRKFIRRVGARTQTWTRVRDAYVDAD